MTDLEESLRRALVDQPATTDAAYLLARVERTLGRRQRARRLGATAAAVVAVLALAGGGVWAAHQRPTGTPTAAGRAGVVPWVNTPGTPEPASALAPSAPPAASWPSCAPAALRGAFGSVSDWAGTSGVSLTIANAGRRGCVLTGAPSAVVLVRPNGATVPVTRRPVSAASVDLHAPAALAPGQHAEFVLAASDVCPRQVPLTSAEFKAVRFRVGSGPWMRVAAPNGGTIDLACARWFSGFGTRLRAPDPVKANPLHALQVTSTMPATVRAGTRVRYRVTLSNPTGHAVALSPCPTYTEFLTPARSDPQRAQHTYRLNCAGAGGRIPAHGRVVFAMQVPAPPTPGAAKFGWSIANAGLNIGRALTVTGPAAPPQRPGGHRQQQPTAAGTDGWLTFTSPTGNITCAMNKHGAGCDVADMHWPLTAADVASCGQMALAGLSLPAHGTVGFDCRTDVAVPDPQRVLAYGKTIADGPITCSSAATGVTCRDRSTGHGFFVSRDSFRRY